MAATDGAGTRAPIAPALADAIARLGEAGYWANAMDDQWRLVAITSEQAALMPDLPGTGVFYYGPEARDMIHQSAVGNTVDPSRMEVRQYAQWMLDDLGVEPDALRDMLHPALRDAVDERELSDSDVRFWEAPTAHLGGKVNLQWLALRVRDSTGRVVGTLAIFKPAVGTTTVAMFVASADLNHLHRMQQLGQAARRPTAVLFADLEGSAQLSKRMPTSAYFKLIRRITRAADECVIDAGGLVGRHAGDGVASFFVAETFGSESTAARACIEAAKALQDCMPDIAERHDLSAGDVTVRAGLHWGATLHIGSIITPGRTEVTALGDAVNEAARIEACATGGRVLVSKDLMERLDLADVALLGIDPDRVSYTQLGDLETATEKARRDAPAIPVCDVASSFTDAP